MWSNNVLSVRSKSLAAIPTVSGEVQYSVIVSIQGVMTVGNALPQSDKARHLIYLSILPDNEAK